MIKKKREYINNGNNVRLVGKIVTIGDYVSLLFVQGKTKTEVAKSLSEEYTRHLAEEYAEILVNQYLREYQ